jgi:exodeoxyribonuclease VII large subunit
MITPSQGTTRIYSVTELTSKIKAILEQNFPFIWLTAEISNFRMPSSRHYYFTLKDENSQIQAVMFRGQNQNLKFVPEDGMAVTGLGRISLYEPRGTYQIILEYLEPKGVGALQIAFEQLKNRLSEEGLFDSNLKKPLPYLPEAIGLITSPTGAVVHDMLHIVQRRCPGRSIDILPVKVQGDSAETDIVSAIELCNRLRRVDVIILARGGGSLEDLQAFNAETVARAIYSSDIPVITAIGHETDFTIADFVADLRAPTPSAAAELVVPVATELYKEINKNKLVMIQYIQQYIRENRQSIANFVTQLVDPRKKIADYRLKLDDDSGRLSRAVTNVFRGHKDHLAWQQEKLIYNSPTHYVDRMKEKLEHIVDHFNKIYQTAITDKRIRLRECDARLNGLNPRAILSRGYSIARTLPGLDIVRDSAAVSVNQKLEIILARGSMSCDVKERFKNGKKII